jgi:hypothetical protein
MKNFPPIFEWKFSRITRVIVVDFPLHRELLLVSEKCHIFSIRTSKITWRNVLYVWISFEKSKIIREKLENIWIISRKIISSVHRASFRRWLMDDYGLLQRDGIRSLAHRPCKFSRENILCVNENVKNLAWLAMQQHNSFQSYFIIFRGLFPFSIIDIKSIHNSAAASIIT